LDDETLAFGHHRSAAKEIAALLAATHKLKMIVTSRAALHLS